MEKDHFNDRSKQSKIYSDISIGSYVFICEKDMQKKASNISHLTFGKVQRRLTRNDHPRGIKVEIEEFSRKDDEGTFFKTNNMKIGRVVYLVVDGIIQRN